MYNTLPPSTSNPPGERPYFSLIIPTYNRADHLKETLATVCMQTFRNFEVIVVDDGSTDHTEAVVHAVQSLAIRYIKIPNSERGAARNCGMAIGSGLYYTFLDSDDQLESTFFEHAYALLERAKHPHFAHLGYAVYDSQQRVVRRMGRVRTGDGRFIIKGNPLSCIGVLMHHSLFPTYRFNEDRRLSGSEDWELWIRILARYGIVAEATPVARLIDHKERSVLNYDENKLVLRKSLAVSYALADPQVRKAFGKYQYIMDAYWYTYVSLHLALSNKKKAALRFLLLGMVQYPPVLFEKRSVVVLKKIVIG